MPDYTDCRHVMALANLFLDGELTELEADAVRHHLLACEHCLDRMDAEQALRALLRRCCGAERAPETLRVRVISQLHEGFGATVEVHSIEVRRTLD